MATLYSCTLEALMLTGIHFDHKCTLKMVGPRGSLQLILCSKCLCTFCVFSTGCSLLPAQHHKESKVCWHRCMHPQLICHGAQVPRFGLAVRLVSRGTLVRTCFSSPFSSKIVVCGHCLVTLSLTINETLKWFLSLPISMQGSFWW